MVIVGLLSGAFWQFTVRDLTSGHDRLLRYLRASQPAMASSEHRFPKRIAAASLQEISVIRKYLELH
jgi:hypothetical protein